MGLLVGAREPASANCPGREWVENVWGPKVVTPGMVIEDSVETGYQQGIIKAKMER